MNTRREFISNLTKASALGFLPLPTQSLLADRPANQDTTIDAVEILRLTGPYTSIAGINHQYQARFQTTIRSTWEKHRLAIWERRSGPVRLVSQLSKLGPYSLRPSGYPMGFEGL